MSAAPERGTLERTAPERQGRSRGRTRSGALVAGSAVAMAALTGLVLALHGGGEEGLRVLTRATARVALVLFALVYATSSLRRLWRTPATAWLLRHRRPLGLCFAVAHGFHLAAVVALASALGAAFEYDPVSLVFGGAAYAFVAALAATSSDRAVTALGTARWKRLHRVGVHYVFFVFAVTELPAALVSPLQAAMAGLVVAAAGLRAAAALSRSRERGIAPAA